MWSLDVNQLPDWCDSFPTREATGGVAQARLLMSIEFACFLAMNMCVDTKLAQVMIELAQDGAQLFQFLFAKRREQECDQRFLGGNDLLIELLPGRGE